MGELSNMRNAFDRVQRCAVWVAWVRMLSRRSCAGEGDVDWGR
jgi:hypothetical protein